MNRFRFKALALIALMTSTVAFAQKGGLGAVKTAEFLLDGNNYQDYPEGYENVKKAMEDPSLQGNPRMWLISSKCFMLLYNYSDVQAIKATGVTNPGFMSIYCMSKFYSAKDPVKKGDWLANEGLMQYNSLACALNECGQKLNTPKPNYDSATLYYEYLLDVFSHMADTNVDRYKNQGIDKSSLSASYAEYLARNSNYDKKMQGLKTLVESGTNQMAAYKLYAFGIMEKGDTAKALSTLKMYSDKFPDKTDLFELLLWMYDASGRKSEAIKELDEKIKVAPNAKYYFLRGYKGYNMNSNADEALEYYKKALELDPGNYDANWEYGRIVYNKSYTDYNNLSASQQKAQKDKYTVVWKEAKQHLMIATENSEYTKDDKILLLGNLKNICLMLGETSDANMYDEQIKALKSL